MRLERQLAALMCAVAALSGCGGGGDGGAVSSSPAPAPAPPAPSPVPAPTLTLTNDAPAGQVVEGGAAVTLVLSGTTAASGAVAWSVSPSIGSLSNTSSTGASYTPPALGVLTTQTDVTVTATPKDGNTPSTKFTITLLPFGVLSTSAVFGADIGLQPNVLFTRNPAPASVNAASFSLSGPFGAVASTVAVQGATATLTPLDGLVWGTRYRLNLTNGITSSVGQPLTPTTYEFLTAASTWTAPASIQPTQPYTGSAPLVAFGRSGHAFAAWLQSYDNSHFRIQTSRFDLATKTWAPASTFGGNVPNPQVSIALASNPLRDDAVATWVEGVGGAPAMYAARYLPAQNAWGAPELVRAPIANANLNPAALAMDAAGNVTAVFGQSAILSTALYAARFDAPTSTWQAPVRLDGGLGGGYPAQVGMDGAGNVIAAWPQGDGTVPPQIAVARWDIATRQWSAPQVVQTSSLRGSNPQLSVAANGDATVVWSQTTAAASVVINVAQFSRATNTWSAPQLLSVATGTANWPQVQTDLGGNVTVFWQQIFGNYAYSVSASRFDAATKTWSPPVAIQRLENYTFNPFSWPPSLTVDAGGNLTAAWLQGDSVGGGPAAYAARFDGQTKSWSVPVQLNGTAMAAAGGVFLAVDSHGSVLAGWGLQDASSFVTPFWAVLTGP